MAMPEESLPRVAIIELEIVYDQNGNVSNVHGCFNGRRYGSFPALAGAAEETLRRVSLEALIGPPIKENR